MKVRLRTFARFREVFGDGVEVDLAEGATLADLLGVLREQHPEGGEVLFDEAGSVKGYVILLHNKTRVKRSDLSKTVLSEGDEVAILPPVAGG